MRQGDSWTGRQRDSRIDEAEEQRDRGTAGQGDSATVGQRDRRTEQRVRGQSLRSRYGSACPTAPGLLQAQPQLSSDFNFGM